MSFQTRKVAIDAALGFMHERAITGRSTVNSAQDLVEAATHIETYLVADGDPWDEVGQNSTTIADQLATMESNIERLITMTVDLSQAEADFAAAVTADTAAKDALKQQIADLTAANSTLQATDTADQAALAAALQQVAEATAALEAGAQTLNPLPTPPAPTPDPVTDPAPTDGSGTPTP